MQEQQLGLAFWARGVGREESKDITTQYLEDAEFGGRRVTWILTNDDGIDAPGLAALAQSITAAAIIVAPQRHHSGCGHQVTTASPIQIQAVPDFPGQHTQHRAYAIAGTPVDCVRVALKHLCPSATFVLSGINSGANLGVDSYISGTVAAVREAAFHHIPGIAISQYHRKHPPINWQTATHWSTKAIKHLLEHPLPPGHFWNVNLPHLPPNTTEPDLVFCRPCSLPLPVSFQHQGDTLLYTGNYANRPCHPGTDVTTCFGGQIAVTQLQISGTS